MHTLSTAAVPMQGNPPISRHACLQAGTIRGMNWSTYVKRMTRGQTQQQVADQAKVADQTTVGRWRRGTTSPKDPAVVAAFAQAYGAPVLEAFVAAGFLTREEAGMPPAHGIDFEALVDEDDALSENAKIHLKNQYGLLKAASVVDRTQALRESIRSDPELDEKTRKRLLDSFDSTNVTTIYSSTATVVEHPFLPMSEGAGKPEDLIAADEREQLISREQMESENP